MRIFLVAMALIAQAGEWLAMPMPDGFATGYRQTAQMGSIEERIPKGETVESWTRMITLITLNGDLEPELYAGEFDKRLVGGCPGAKAWPRTKSHMGARPAIDGRLDCPRNPTTGLPETLFYRIAGAPGHIHMVQVAFRSVPDAGGIAWARAQIDGTVLCVPGSNEPACKR